MSRRGVSRRGDRAAALSGLWAHVLTSMVANLVSIVVVVLVTLALTLIAVIPGLTASSVDGASAFSYRLIFLPFVSSA